MKDRNWPSVLPTLRGQSAYTVYCEEQTTYVICVAVEHYVTNANCNAIKRSAGNALYIFRVLEYLGYRPIHIVAICISPSCCEISQ
jgi:hypothetical protein